MIQYTLTLSNFKCQLFTMSSAPNARIRIFDYWQMQQPTLESQPQKRKTAESALASEVLTQALLLSSNIREFLEERDKYGKRVDKCMQRIQGCSSYLHQLCNSQVEEYEKWLKDESLFKENLAKLYVELRQSKVMLFCIRDYFQKANLANYDPNIMQLNYTQNGQFMKRELAGFLESINKRMYQLTEAQQAGPFLGEYSGVFGKEYSSQFCLTALQQLLRHQNLVKIHFLMLYQIEEFSKTVNEFAQFLKISQAQYLRYELVLDCLTLMRQEAKQMRNLIDSAQQDLEDACSNPSQIDHNLLSSKQQKRLKLWKQNIVIYQANLDNFTRVNVETSMIYYTYLKGRFIEQLQKFIEETDKCQQRNRCLIYLIDRYSLYQDLKRRVELGHKLGEGDRRLLLNIYNESGAYEVPSYCASLYVLKDTVLTDIELFLANKGIAYNRRIRHSKPAPFSISRQSKLLRDLQQSHPRVSYSYITSNYKNIKSSLFQLESLLNDKDKLMKKDQGSNQDIQERLKTVDSTKLALMYAEVMANDKSFKDKLNEFQEIKVKEFKDLPIKFQQPLFKYIADISVICQHRQLQKQRNQSLQIFKNKVSEAMVKSLQKSNIDGIVEKQAECLKEMWFSSYNEHLKRVSNYGEDLIFDEIGQLSYKISQAITGSFDGGCKLIQTKKMDIQARLFFTHRVLNELMKQIDKSKGDLSQFRIIKLDKVLEQIFRDLDNNFLSKKLGGKVSDIVKLSLLQKYLSKVYRNNNLITAIRTLRKIAYYQSLADIYPTCTEDKNVILGGLLQLQLKMGEINANFKDGDEFQKLLDDNIMRLVKEMRRYPLTLAAKHDVSGFVAVFRYKFIIEELQIIIGKKLLTIIDIAKIYICIQDLKSCRKCSQTPYDSYQNIIVKQRKSIQQYFSRIRHQLTPRIESISDQMQLSSKCFMNTDQVISLNRAVQSLCRKAN